MPKFSKNLSIIAFLSVFLAAFVYYIQSPKGTLQSEETQFAISDSGTVNKIIIKQKLKILTLTKSENDWKTNQGFVAEGLFIENLKNLMYKSTIKKPISKEILQKIKEILIAEASEISYFENNTLLKKVRYISDSQELIGLIDGFSNPYFIDFQVVGKVPFANLISADEQNWRDRTIFSSSISTIETLNVIYNDSSKYSFSIERGKNSFAILGMPKADSAKILAYLDLYKSVQIRRYCSDNEQIKKDSLLKIRPTFVIELKDKFKNKSNVIAIYYALNQKTDIYGLLNDKKELCVIKPRVFEYLLQKRYFFESKNK